VFASPRVKNRPPFLSQVEPGGQKTRAAATVVLLLAVVAMGMPLVSAPATGHAARVGASPSPLSANVTYSDLGGSWNCGQGHQTFQFFGHVEGGVAPYDYNWTFGDGTNSSAAPSPTHSFARFGQFVVNISVRDAAGSVLKASVSPVWGIPLYCSGSTQLGPLGLFGVALYVILILAIVLGAALLVRARRRRQLP
jgi:hypothetical protein